MIELWIIISIYISFEFKVEIRFSGEPVKEFFVMSPHIMLC